MLPILRRSLIRIATILAMPIIAGLPGSAKCAPLLGAARTFQVSLAPYSVAGDPAADGDMDLATGDFDAHGGDSEVFFRGRPAPGCKVFALTQAGVAARLDHGSQKNRYGNAYGMFDLGVMRNLDREHALGGTLFVGTGDHRTRVGLKARYRRWLSSVTSLDFAPGIVLGGQENPYLLRPPGGMVQASLDHRDLVGATVQLEVIRVERDNTGQKSTDIAVYAGAHFGSYATVAGSAAVALYLLVGLLSSG